jgi:two-component system OmpR family response regulator
VTKLAVEDLNPIGCRAGEARRPEDRPAAVNSALEYLMRHAGLVVMRAPCCSLGGLPLDPQTNVIDVHVSRLRQKVDKPFPTPLIHTVRNAGYMLRAESA